MTEVFNIKQGLYFGILDLQAFGVKMPDATKRDIERAGKQYLINHLFDSDVAIEYHENGKPFLPNKNCHISISHSHDKLAVMVNENEPTGIDIELIRDKVKTIKNRFLSSLELTDANDDTEKLLIYWAAKEALYKIYGLKEVEFIKNLFVKPFTKHNLGIITGQINLPELQETFQLNYQLLDNYVLVYVLNKIQD